MIFFVSVSFGFFFFWEHNGVESSLCVFCVCVVLFLFVVVFFFFVNLVSVFLNHFSKQ